MSGYPFKHTNTDRPQAFLLRISPTTPINKDSKAETEM